jgi:DNA-binding CsgD family transcriptional regulator
MVHPDDAERARVGWEHSTRTRTPFDLMYRIRRSDGEQRWHAFRALPARGANGQVLRWIGTADDIHDRLAEDDTARVRRQAGQLRALLETLEPDPRKRLGFVEPGVLAARVNEALRSDPLPGVVPPDASEAAGAVPLLDHLTPRELAVLRLVAAGYTNAEAANLLGVSLRGVEASRAGLRRTLGLRSRAEFVRFATNAGLTGEPEDLP